MKKGLIFLLGILLINGAIALEFSAEFDSLTVIKELKTALPFTITIMEAPSGTYNVFTLADLTIEPGETFTLQEPENVTKQFILQPTQNLDVEGKYRFTYTLNHRGVQKYDLKETIEIISITEALEITTQTIELDSSEIVFTITNTQDAPIKGVAAEFSSLFFKTTETLNLNPKESIDIRVIADTEKLRKTKAGIYVIEATLQTPEGKKEINGNLYLGEKQGITTIEDIAGFISRTNTITKVNSGNTIENTQVTISKNVLSRLFTTFNMEPTTVTREGATIKYLFSKQRLGPTESFTVKATTNYALPLIVFIVLILLLLGLRRFSETKVDVVKAVTPVKTKGGEFALKVTLTIKAKKDLENLSIIDRVPAIVKIYKKFGTIKPDKINAESRRIHWNLGDLAAGEERILNYIVYSKVGVVGKFSLPRALAVFEKDASIHEVESNTVFFLNDQVKG